MYAIVKHAEEHTALAKNVEKLHTFSSIIEKVREEKVRPQKNEKLRESDDEDIDDDFDDLDDEDDSDDDD